ncbi:MAG TPA: AAA family ATPase [Solirubrobacteraceae bacterium]|nr:AAA family ATPase [Solirubrobacteraceae bacterium]
MLHRVSSPTFVGRAEELAALDGALGRAAAGVPAFTFIAGESGVGKSRLVAELEIRARSAGARVFVGHCLELGGAAIPYAPLVDALRPIARELADCGSDVADGLPPASRAALADLMPEFRAADAEDDGDGAHQARVFEALLALIERLGRVQPVVLVLEDLHWADQSTRDFLTFLVRSARTEPLSLVVTYRSDELHRRHPLRPLLAELERTPGVDRLGLERFSRAELVAQISAILDEPASDELADRLFERSEGNALYTEELLAASSDGYQELPETLRDLLVARVERLPEGAQEVVRTISVEHPMRHSLLAALSDADEADLLRGLREAVAHQVLVTGHGETYAFRHALVGEAVYGDLLPGERSALHARLAETVDARHELLGDAPAAAVAGILACHWNAAHDVPRALGASVAAGLASKRVLAFSEAQRHFERALELWDRVPDAEQRAGLDRAEVLRHAAAAAANAGEAARSLALSRKAIAEIDAQADPLRAAFLYERLGHYLRWAGETEEGFAAYMQAMELLPDGDSAQRARLLEYRARGLALRGRFEEGVEGATEALAMAERCDDLSVQARALNTIGLSRAALGDVENGIALLRSSRDLAAERRQVEQVMAITNLSDVLDLAGRTAEGLAEIEAGMEALRANPERTSYDTFMELQGVSLMIKLGRLRELEAGLPAPKFGDSVGTTPIFLAELRARLALLVGDTVTARRQLDEFRRLCLGTRDPQWMEPLHAHEADLALLEDRPDDARDAIRRGIGSLKGSQEGARLVRLAWLGLMAEATAAERSRALGDPASEADAERLLAVIERAKALPGRWADVPAHEALALAELSRMRVALGSGEPDPAAWEGAVEAFAALEQPWPAAYAGFRAAEAHVQAGDRAAAAEPLRAARERAEAMGVRPLLGEIDALARRARLAVGEAEPAASEAASEAPESPAEQLGLTRRELEVLLLVAAGRTNREIGAELFMSDKTASVHVSRILAKLGVGGRVEAAAVAHRLGLTDSAASV